jgi:hypothetical protein
MTLIMRKLLASYNIAIAGTLDSLARELDCQVEAAYRRGDLLESGLIQIKEMAVLALSGPAVHACSGHRP